MTLPALLRTGAAVLASPMIWIAPDVSPHVSPLAAPAARHATGAPLAPALQARHPRGARTR